MKYAFELVGFMATLVMSGTALAQSTTSAERPISFTSGMSYIKIETTDFNKSTAFYKALGMKPGWVRDDTRNMSWEGPTGNSGIVMANSAYAARTKLVRGGASMVFMTPDVNAALDRMRKAGFAGLPEPRQMGTIATVVFLTDPDGNSVELLGPPSGK